ncbi:HNH endonuclease signature motif containing protein, partial [Cylindrospermopsis raciborskii]
KCPICGEPLLNGDGIETHHIVPVAKGGLDDIENLKYLHLVSHKQAHSKPKLKGLNRMMGNCQVRFLGEGRIVMSNPYPTGFVVGNRRLG